MTLRAAKSFGRIAVDSVDIRRYRRMSKKQSREQEAKAGELHGEI